MSNTKWFAAWSDEQGNVKCAKCGKVQDASYKACIYCCQHNTLNFVRSFGELDLECADCGKNFDWKMENIIRDYKAIRRK